MTQYHQNRSGVCILGSTGSIGQSTLAVIDLNANDYYVNALCANSNVEKMFQQCITFRPVFACLRDSAAAKELSLLCHKAGLKTQVMSGENSEVELVEHSDSAIVMSAIVGAAGLKPTLAAVCASKKVLIANKEPIVMIGELLSEFARQHDAIIIPVDSEHNAIFQCLPAHHQPDAEMDFKHINRLLLTGSGGPFRSLPIEQFANVSVEQALAHPNWSMGPKISIDSATMMNKSLELIEACKLFHVKESAIDVVIHPQSIIHSMVTYKDGSTLAQLGASDMKVAIAHALAWPNRCESGVQQLAFSELASLDFEAPDLERFPSLVIGREVARKKGFYPTFFNAANEVAVQAFLDKRIKFTEIVNIVEDVLTNDIEAAPLTVDSAIEADFQARRWANDALKLYSR